MRTAFHEIFLLLVRPEILQEQLFSWYFGTFDSGLAWSLEAEPCENPDGKSNFSQCVWSSATAWKIHVLILYLCPAVTFRFKCFLTHTSFFCCCKLAASHNPSSQETESIKWSLILRRDDFELRRRLCCPWSQPSNYLNTTVYFTPELPHLMSEECGSLEWGLDVATVVINKELIECSPHTLSPKAILRCFPNLALRHHLEDKLIGAETASIHEFLPGLLWQTTSHK